MKDNFTIFFSWQSDIREQMSVIKKNILESSDKLDKELSVKIQVDEATRDRSGFVDIPQTVFQKIRMCDIFICDITPIQNLEDKLLPNPNVLIELGYAIACLGVNRIIAIHNPHFGKIKHLPFDISKNRITPYSMKLYEPIKIIIEQYEEIIEENKKDNFNEHDKLIYTKLDKICSEDLLFESLDFAVNNLLSNKFYYRTWDNLIYSIQKQDNSYINPDLAVLANKLACSISDFKSICAVDFYQTMEHRWRYFDIEEDNLSSEEIDNILQNQWYGFPKFEEFRVQTVEDYTIRRKELLDSLLNKYHEIRNIYNEYRMEIKKVLLI